LLANGLIYTPDLNFNGNDELTATADDFHNAAIPGRAAITVSALNDAPVLAHAGPSVSMHGFAVLDPDLSVTDAGLDSLNGGEGNYAGATFTIERQGGGNPDEGFYIDGSSGITIGAGNVLQINGQTFATASVANNSFTISFTSNVTIATSALVDNFLQHIGYQNSNATPGSNVTLDYTFDDGAPHFGSNAGHSTATASMQVDITVACYPYRSWRGRGPDAANRRSLDHGEWRDPARIGRRSYGGRFIMGRPRSSFRGAMMRSGVGGMGLIDWKTQELASSMASTSIDGTWRRDCVLQEASDRGAKLLVRGSIEGLNLD
jgi:hypothetical protein